MKKHFLLLLLMTLLPLAGWAVSADLATKPTLATGLVYDGTDQALTTGSFVLPSDYDTAVGGVLWAVTTTDVAPEATAEGVAFAEVKAKNTGKYWVWYKVLADGDQYHDDGGWTQIGTSFVRINRGVPSYSTEIAGAEGLVYNGGEQSLVGTVPVATLGTVQYKLEGGVYSETAPKATNAGTYTVYYKVAEAANWVGIEESSIEVTIGRANATVTAPTAIEGGLTYNRTAQNLVNAGSVAETGVVLQYSLEENGLYTAEIPTATNASDYTVYYKVDEANYSSVVGHVDVSIAPKSLGTDGVAAEGFTFAVKAPNRTFKAANWTFVSSQLTTKDGENNLINNTDFELTYGNNFNATPENPTDEQKPYVLFTGIGNYTGTAKAYFNIAQLDITDNAEVTIQAIADQTYNAEQIKPNELTVKYGSHSMTEAADAEAAGDYYLTYGENTQAGTGEATVTINGKGNYTGTKTVNFNIQKATLTVTADSKEKYFGSADPATTYTLTGFLGTTDNKDNINLTGAPNITRANGEDVGSYVYILNVNTLKSDNYEFVAADAAEQGSLTIKAATAIVTPTAIEAQTYGYTLPDPLDKNAFAFTTSGLKAGHSITSMDYTVINAETEEVQAAGATLPVGTYTVIPSNAECNVPGYTITYNNVTLTVNPKEIKIVAQNQKLDFANPTPALDKDTDPDGESNYQSWTNSRIRMFDSSENTILKSEFVAKYGVWKEAFVESLTWEEHDGTVANPGIIKVNLKDGISANFIVTPVNGTVTYTNVESDITITRLDNTENPNPGTTVADKLFQYNGVTAKIKLNATSSNPVFNTIKADRWYSLVLPFNTSVREVSQAFGYAVVDIMDETSSKTTDIDFRLYLGDLEANKPFIFKVDKDIDLTSTTVTFTGKEIVYSDEPVASTADGKVKFIGVYDGKTDFSGHEYFFSLGSGNISGTKATTYVVPMGAYIHMENQMDGMSNAPEFHIEEPNGMTTSIKAIDFAKEGSAASSEGWYNLNGVQLESAPNQKGVYIQNGKKIVIK